MISVWDDVMERKSNRLKNYDYSAQGYYFVSVCTAEKQKILCNIVGCGVLDAPKTELSAIGEMVNNQLAFMLDFYNEIKIDKYIVMPNHIHLIIKINNNSISDKRCVGVIPHSVGKCREATKGTGSSSAAPYNNMLSKFIGTFKRYTNKFANCNLWQKSFYDHVIRNEKDYLRIWEYIDTNPAKWTEDKYYTD